MPALQFFQSLTRRDPRDFQIAVLSGLIAYGVLLLDFEVTLPRTALVVGAALSSQWIATRLWRLPRFDPKSALISSLSLTLLLRTADPLLAVLAAAVAIFSKFLLRIDERHVFNPTAFALVVLLLVSDRAWVSPAQWGSSVFLAFLVACLGSLVIRRATRSDVTFAFLGWYVAILFGRALWLGDPLTIPILQLKSGSLLLFAFFMISDPKTTPASATGRVLWAGLIAAGAAAVHFVMYQPNGLLWSLVAFAPTVPLFNRWFPGRAFAWRTGTAPSTQPGERDESQSCASRRPRRVRRAVAA